VAGSVFSLNSGRRHRTGTPTRLGALGATASVLAGIGLVVAGVVLAQPGVAVAIDVQSAPVSRRTEKGRYVG
jgi:hypothetical protein